MFSLMVARFVTPVIAAYFVRAPHGHTHRDGAVMRFVLGSCASRCATGGSPCSPARSFSPPPCGRRNCCRPGSFRLLDYGRALLAIELPPGSRLDDTDRVTRAISDKLRAMPEVRSALIFGGKLMGGADDEPRKATVVINFVHKSKREATQKDLQL